MRRLPSHGQMNSRQQFNENGMEWKKQPKNDTFMEILVNRRHKMPAVDSICNGEDFCEVPLYYPKR